MTSVLIAWELGGGLGHVGPVRAVGAALVERGWRVRLAAANAPLCRQALTGVDIDVLPCPVLPLAETRLKVPCTFSDVLHDCGYASAERVTAAVAAWRRVFDEAKPDLLLADYSPTAMLAARACGLPTVVIGSGFTCPPEVSPLPSLHEQVTAPHWAAEVESVVLASMNGALLANGGPSLERVGQLYGDATHRLLLTLPELDHYPDRAESAATEFVGPVGVLDGARVDWPRGDGPRVFVYVRDTPAVEPLLRGLAVKRIPTVAYAPDLREDVAEELRQRGVVVATTPIDLRPLLAECDAAVLNGGHLTVCEFVLAGTPVLALPLSLEQAVTGRRLRECGAGLDVPADDLGAIAAALEDLMSDGRHAAAARAIAERHAAIAGEGRVAAVVRAIEGYAL